MNIQLSDHFTYKKLLRFTCFPILMMVFTSLYGIVDGFFVSNFLGKTPFAAVNLVFPFAVLPSTVGFMIGAGGNAIISKTLGEQKHELANEYFSLLVYFAMIISVVLSISGYLLMPFIADLLNVSGDLREYCIIYGKILFLAQFPFVLQNMFQQFFVTAQKPSLSFKVSLLAGLTNMILDYVFIAKFKMGIGGAALASALGQVVGGISPLIYFSRENDSLLRLGKTKIRKNIILKACTNGSSEMVTNISLNLLNILYNVQLMKFAGENGVAAFGIIMYVNIIFLSIFIGFSNGSSPIVGYHYGAKNDDELKNLFKKSLFLMFIGGALMFILAQLLTRPLVNIFAGYDKELFEMTCLGFRIYSLSFLIVGINIWSSAFFTALNNGFVSAMISFLRTFVFEIIAIELLPLLFELNGVWFAAVFAETMGVFVSIYFLYSKRNIYKYA